MTRFPDWPARLEAFLFANADRKFKYGEWDCCLFVADAIHAMTGTDLAVGFRGYGKRSEGLGYGAYTVRSIVKAVTALYRMPEVEPVRASRGDMVLIRRPHDFSLGLVALNGRSILIALKRGYGPIPLERAHQVWRV